MPTIIDDFEDGDISEYSGPTNDFTVTSNTAYNGTYSLRADAFDVDGLQSTPGDGLNYYPQAGDRIRVWLQIPPTDNEYVYFYFGTDGTTGECYEAELDNDIFWINEITDGGSTSNRLIDQQLSLPTGEWVLLEIDWNLDGSSEIVGTVYDSSLSEIASGSGTSTLHADQRGIAFRGEDPSHWDYVHKPTRAPGSPQSLSATPVSSDQNDLSWQPPSTGDDPDQYHIYRATSSGSSLSDYTQIDSVGGGTTTFSDTGLLDGERYYYRITAENEGGEGDPSNEADAQTDLSVPTGLSEADVRSTEADVTWTANHDNGETRLEHKPSDGSTWTSSGTVNYDVESGTVTGLRTGDQQDIRVVATTEHTETASSAITVTTDLPDEDQPVLGNGVEDEIQVDRESTVSNYGSVRIQTRETGETSWDSNATGWAEQVIPYDQLTTTIQSREDGEEYEIRARTETEHVTGNWTDPVSIVTKFPGAQDLALTVQGPTQIDGTFDDVSDNEDGFEVWRATELDPLRDTGFSDFEQIADLAPNETTFSDAGLEPNHDYRYYIRAYTDDTSATTATVEATTGVDIPNEGWYLVLERGDGDKATVPHDLFDGNERPRLQPEQSAAGRWEIGIVPNDVLSNWTRAEAYIYYAGDLWFRGPFTRYAPDGGRGSGSASLTGLDIINHLRGGAFIYDVQSEPAYDAFKDFVQQELGEWSFKGTEPGQDLVDDGLLVQDASTQTELEDIFAAAIDDTTPLEITNGEVRPLQVCWTVEAEDYDRGSGDDNFGTQDSAYSGGSAEGHRSNAVTREYDFTVPYEIPEGEFQVYYRAEATGGDVPDITYELDGTEIATTNNPLSLQWHAAIDPENTSSDPVGTVEAGEHTLSVTKQSTNTSESRFIDLIAPLDKGDRYGGFNYTFENSVDGNQSLAGPEWFRAVDAVGTEFAQSWNVIAADVTADLTDTSNAQRLQASNDLGQTWFPNDGSEQNTASVTARFDQDGEETYGTQVKGRATLGGYEPDGPRSQTPRLGYESQGLTDWELRIDTNSIHVIDDQTFTGSAFSVLNDITSDSNLTFIADYQEDQLALECFQPGDETADVNWTVEDSSPVDTTEGYYNTITVIGPEQEDGTRLQATAQSDAEVDRVGVVRGEAEERPDATTQAELAAIARTLVAKGVARDRVTGTLEISGQLVRPGVAYRVEEFEQLDDRTDPRYVLQSAEFSWGTMELDFEARNPLARAIQSIETEVRQTRRAV